MNIQGIRWNPIFMANTLIMTKYSQFWTAYILFICIYYLRATMTWNFFFISGRSCPRLIIFCQKGTFCPSVDPFLGQILRSCWYIFDSKHTVLPCAFFFLISIDRKDCHRMSMPLYKRQLHEGLCRTIGFTIQLFMRMPLETENAQGQRHQNIFLSQDSK